MMSDDKKQLILPGVWAGSSVLLSLIAFLVLSFGPLARRLDRQPLAPAGGARLAAWLAATASVAAVAVLGAAVAVTVDASEMLPLFGFVPWARWGAWLGFVAGLLGLVAVVMTVRARDLPRSRFIGFTLTGLAALSLGLFLHTWDLGPF